MAPLAPLPLDLPAEVRSAIDANVAARAHVDEHPGLSEVYAALFHAPAIASAVSVLGQALRFSDAIPADLRELAILRFAEQTRIGYEWAHHQLPAKQAGLSVAIIEALGRGEVPEECSSVQRDVIAAVDCVLHQRSIPADIQTALADALGGEAGIVALVTMVGLYRLIGAVITSFDVALEAGLSRPPWDATGA